MRLYISDLGMSRMAKKKKKGQVELQPGLPHREASGETS